MEFRRGLVTAIMGPSGTGKTTLLRLIGGQLRADRGVVRVEGRDVASLVRRDLYALRKRMGMLFQNGALLTDLSVFENVASVDLVVQSIETIVGRFLRFGMQRLL